jgi:hypothetical protein
MKAVGVGGNTQQRMKIELFHRLRGCASLSSSIFPIRGG